MQNEALMTMVQGKNGCDNYLLSYEHFYLPNLPSKMSMKKCFLLQQLECRCGPTATVTSLKVTWNKVLIKHFNKSGLTLEIMLPTQSNRHFLNLENCSFFAFWQKGDPMRISWKASILQMAESDIFFVK